MKDEQLQVRYKVWLERGGEVALSDWRVQLLEEIDRRGSLAEAARQLDVPYKTAWYKLKEMEEALGVGLVTTASGGPKGGGASLTEAAKGAIEHYHQLIEGLDELLEARFREAFRATSTAASQGNSAQG